MSKRIVGLLVLTIVMGFMAVEFVSTRAGTTLELVSQSTLGERANQPSSMESMSEDGRYVVFSSNATNLDVNANGTTQVYIRDRIEKTTKMVSRSPSGQPGNITSYRPSIGSDGQYVVFISYATNLLSSPIQTNTEQIYAYNVATEQISLVTKSFLGGPSNASPNNPTVNGHFVTFSALATNLIENVKGYGVYVFDLSNNTINIIYQNDPQGSGSLFANRISRDGSCIGFDKRIDENYVTKSFAMISINGTAHQISDENDFAMFTLISSDCSVVTYTRHTLDSNGKIIDGDVIVYDIATESYTNLSEISGLETAKNPTDISSDGKFIKLVLIDGTVISNVVLNRETLEIATLPASDHQYFAPKLSTDGDEVVFRSLDTSLSPNEGNIYVTQLEYSPLGSTPTPTFTPTSTPTLEPHRNPIVFIPGIMGSQMRYRDGEEYNLTHDSYLWPTYPDVAKKRMSMKDGGDPRVYTNDVLRDYIPLGPVINKPRYDVYKPFIDYIISKGYTEYRSTRDLTKLTICDQSQQGANLFVFPWDFRAGASAENVEKLSHIVSCAVVLNDGSNVDIVAHSMGGYLAQEYILSMVDNNLDPHVRKFMSIGTPWLGAPKTIGALLTGDLDKSTNALISQEYVRGLTEHFVGSHELLPSSLYFQHSSRKPLVLSKLSVDGITRLADDIVTRDNLEETLRRYYRSPWEPEGYVTDENMIAHNDALFSDSRFYDWTEKYGIEYHVFYGNHWLQTVGQLRAVEQRVCDHSVSPSNCKTITMYKPRMVLGDGTVPLTSAKKFGSSYDYNHGAVLHLFVDNPDSAPTAQTGHLELTMNTKVQNCIISLSLHNGSCSESEMRSASILDDEVGGIYPLKYITLWGITSLEIADSITQTGELITNTLALNIPGIGIDYMADNAVNITFLATKPYTVSVVSEGIIFADILEGTNNFTPTLTTLYDNVQVPAGQLAQIRSTMPETTILATDTDGDGKAETVIQPNTTSQGFSLYLPLVTR